MITKTTRRLALVAIASAATFAIACQPDQTAQPATTAAAKPLFPPRFGSDHVPDKAANSIRVATYNVENLFDDVDDPTLSGDQEDIDDRKPDGQLDAVALAIHSVNADVICLEEVESLDALHWFMDSRLADMGYDYIVSIDAGDERGIEQAVLSRFPIVETKNWPKRPLGGVHPDKYGNSENWYAGKPITFHRSPLMVVVEVPGETWGGDEPWRLRLFAVHMKSGRYSDYWREKEAEGLVSVMNELRESEGDLGPTLILGDFNATGDAKSVQTLVDAGFHDLFADNTGAKTKWISHESGRRIDLILANDAAAGCELADSETIYGTPARPAEISWRDMTTFEGYASDHYPVMVDLSPSRSLTHAP
ncbi:MAG: endonuclease/exonuclease/phosphatase family protein [Phycisphaerales bacterium]